MEVYDYRVFRLYDVISLTMVSVESDSYIAEDRISEVIKDSLRSGYRWVRSEGDYAIFERKEVRK